MMRSPRRAHGGRTARARWPVLALLALTVVSTAAGTWLEAATKSLDASAPEEVALLAAFMAFPLVGALIATRHPRNAVGWIFLGIGVLVGALIIGTAYARYGLVLHPSKHLPLPTLGAWLENWAWMPLIGTIPTLLLLLFPTGRPPSRRWFPVAWAAGGLIALVTVLSMLEERLVGDGYSVANPIGVSGLQDVEEMDGLLVPLLVLMLLCAASLIFRYRNGTNEERQQLKWVAVAATVFVAGVLLSATVGAPGFFFPVFLGAIPVTVGIAILRFRLYDIDLIINRTLVYGVLTALLAGTYLAIVVLLQRLVPGADDSDLAVAGSTLAVAALFGPLRGRLQAFIDQRFYRTKYDAQRTLEGFTATMREDVDIEHLRRDLLAVVGDTMRPAHASLWLRPVPWDSPGRAIPSGSRSARPNSLESVLG